MTLSVESETREVRWVLKMSGLSEGQSCPLCKEGQDLVFQCRVGSEESALAVKKTVQSQLAAFAADDAELAFSYAAPGIQKLFKTSDNFMSMVQQTYPVVYRPANILFLKAKVLDSIVVQPVRLWDQVGGVWLAAYDLERQADGRWLITACVLVRDKSAVDLTTLI